MERIRGGKLPIVASKSVYSGLSEPHREPRGEWQWLLTNCPQSIPTGITALLNIILFGTEILKPSKACDFAWHLHYFVR